MSRAGVGGAAFNLIVSIVGCGILSFPEAFKDSGILWAFLLLLCCACFAYISLNLLIIASDAIKTQFPDRNIIPSYPTLAMISGGRPLALFTQIVVIISLWGSANSRILGAAQIIVSLYSSFFNETDDDQLGEIKTFSIIAFTVIVIFPLGLMRSMSSLKFTSILSVMCSVFLSICLLVEYLRCSTTDTVCVWNFDRVQINGFVVPSIKLSDVLDTIPIFIFGYNCHPSVFPIYKALLEDNKMADSSSMSLVFKCALTVSAVLYTIAGSCGLLLLLDETPGNILDHDFSGLIHMDIAKVLFAVAMILAVPTFVNAIRGTFMEMIIVYRSDHEVKNEEVDPDDVEASTSQLEHGSPTSASAVELPISPSAGSAVTAVSTDFDQTATTKSLKEGSSISKQPTLRLRLNSLRALIFTKSFKSTVSLKSPRSCSPKVLESRFKTCASLKRVNTPHALVRFQSLDDPIDTVRALSRAISNALSPKARTNSDIDSVKPVAYVESKISKPTSPVVGGSAPSNGTSKVTSNINTEGGSMDDVEDQAVEQSTSELSTLWHVIVSCIICIVLAGPAIVVDEIADVFRLLGCTSNPISGYILPTCFVLLLVPPGDMRQIKGLAVLMSMVVSVVSVSALYQQVRDLSGI